MKGKSKGLVRLRVAQSANLATLPVITWRRHVSKTTPFWGTAAPGGYPL